MPTQDGTPVRGAPARRAASDADGRGPDPGGGAGRADPVGPDPMVLRVVGGVLVAVAAVALAVLECFLVPLRIGSVPFPIVVPLAMAGNIVLARLAGRQTGSVVGAAVPPMLWLLVVIVLALPRAEGDLIVQGSLTGLVFLFGGAVAGAYGVASEITRRVKPAPHPRG